MSDGSTVNWITTYHASPCCRVEYASFILFHIGVYVCIDIIQLLLFVHKCCALYERLNLTELLGRRPNAESRDYEILSDFPVIRDVVYLPEESYNEEEERKDDELRSLDRQNRNLMPEYRNLCETVTRRVEFSDLEYEYQPPHYHEVLCKSYSFLGQGGKTKTSVKQKCAHPSFHCVQRSRTLFVVRRAWDRDCWEPFTKQIASGCDCMWPVSILGDITSHY